MQIKKAGRKGQGSRKQQVSILEASRSLQAGDRGPEERKKKDGWSQGHLAGMGCQILEWITAEQANINSLRSEQDRGE